jgi:hypothetical protein
MAHPFAERLTRELGIKHRREERFAAFGPCCKPMICAILRHVLHIGLSVLIAAGLLFVLLWWEVRNLRDDGEPRD